jgi:hypothetical protein
MAEPLSADEARRMRIVSIGMLIGVVMFLGVASLTHQMLKPRPIPIVSWFAVGFALLSPVIAAFVDRAQPDRRHDGPARPRPRSLATSSPTPRWKRPASCARRP